MDFRKFNHKIMIKEPINIVARNPVEAGYIARKKGLRLGEYRFIFHPEQFNGYPRTSPVWLFGGYEDTVHWNNIRDLLCARGFKPIRQFL